MVILLHVGFLCSFYSPLTPEAGEKSQATRVSVAEGSNEFCHAFQQLPHDSGNVNGIQFAVSGCHRTIPESGFLIFSHAFLKW